MSWNEGKNQVTPVAGLKATLAAQEKDKADLAVIPTMSEILQTISEGEDMDAAHILAGVVNLQLGMLQRKQKRNYFIAADIQTIVKNFRNLLISPTPEDK